jgi:hypothetical protein
MHSHSTYFLGVSLHIPLIRQAGKARGGAVSHKETPLVVISFSDLGHKEHAKTDRKQRDRLEAIAIQERGGAQLSDDDKGFTADIERHKRIQVDHPASVSAPHLHIVDGQESHRRRIVAERSAC